MASVASIRKQANDILKEFYGEDAKFRPGQLDAIVNTVQGRRSLVVQKTGWGKSIVYFIACKILRQENKGLTLIISPLLALMNNQIEAAEKLNLNIATVNSDLKGEKEDKVYQSLNELDALIISPERLGNERFNDELMHSQVSIAALVVDEAHCISDWGHDFRPDYQRIVKLISVLPEGLPILGTTATANNRVIEDIRAQLGEDLFVTRGDLMRKELQIQVNPSQSNKEKLAWLVDCLLHDDRLKNKKGLIYCLTINDCIRVSQFLQNYGISAAPYYSARKEDKEQVEENFAKFEAGEIKVLVCTIKLGMGYDASDIRYVIHYQLPKNIIAYYQQIGRAGRDGQDAYIILMHGEQDEEILTSFIRSAHVKPEKIKELIQLLTTAGKSKQEIMEKVDIRDSKFNEISKYLLVHDYIYKERPEGRWVYYANINKTFNIEAEQERQLKLFTIRQGEINELKEFLSLKSCYMQFIANCLDAPDGVNSCGHCENCQHHLLFNYTGEQYLKDAEKHLSISKARITPRTQWGNGSKIATELQAKKGWVFCNEYHSGVGSTLQDCKYRTGKLTPQLIDWLTRFLMKELREEQVNIDAIVGVPSKRYPDFVRGFSKELATNLNIPYIDAIEKTAIGKEQKSINNSIHQQRNIEETIKIHPEGIFNKTILLTDDIINSGWSFTVIAAMLLKAGAKAVYPFAILSTGLRTEE